ncbi:bile acid:sodium symporter family protein [Lutibacter maritimus]|jgi:BASS family bile acid:Na+ symporter|uniref:Bile acid:Na+ symporter, BASS family n=1 Tax=Lutibacter maritimus TaxID=593133 RepID=A0A1I6SCB5_9FLAO|nr:bile acid:sodium symporter family protein [Lutibacter maritimus]SFS74602.1 bile acid:Na+ symporter, BASS family [Lutibacter maritimus]
MIENLDSLKINFDTEGLWVLNITLAIIMFGVALGITIEDFKRLFKNPKILFTGIISQFILLPFVTFIFIKLVNPMPSIALGMMMVAACPGGNISNFMTQMAKGNAALSISLTAFATLVSLVMTPFNLSFWGNLYAPTAEILQTVELDPLELVKLVTLILGIPLIIGMLVRKYKEALAHKLQKVLKPLSLVIFMLFIVIAFYDNLSIFMNYVHYVLILVIAHNLLALLLGFYFAKAMKLSYKDQKTLSIETGIQNSGLGLLLIFSFFNGLGGMALLVAFWAIWDIFSGLALATYWAKQKTKN